MAFSLADAKTGCTLNWKLYAGMIDYHYTHAMPCTVIYLFYSHPISVNISSTSSIVVAKLASITETLCTFIAYFIHFETKLRYALRKLFFEQSVMKYKQIMVHLTGI